MSVPSAFSLDEVHQLADDAIVLALANPEPEVDPDEAREAGAAVVGTGRSDHPNKVNNVLAFPRAVPRSARRALARDRR